MCIFNFVCYWNSRCFAHCSTHCQTQKKAPRRVCERYHWVYLPQLPRRQPLGFHYFHAPRVTISAVVVLAPSDWLYLAVLLVLLVFLTVHTLLKPFSDDAANQCQVLEVESLIIAFTCFQTLSRTIFMEAFVVTVCVGMMGVLLVQHARTLAKTAKTESNYQANPNNKNARMLSSVSSVNCEHESTLGEDEKEEGFKSQRADRYGARNQYIGIIEDVDEGTDDAQEPLLAN